MGLWDQTWGGCSVDEIRQPRRSVFIGHISVDKSTFCDSIMYMSGMVDERKIEKLNQEVKETNRDSYWLAYVMDINNDEKANEKIVEVGRATLET